MRRVLLILAAIVGLVFASQYVGATGYVVGDQMNMTIINWEDLADDFVGDIDSDGDLEIVGWYAPTATSTAGSLMVYNAIAGTRDTALYYTSKPAKIIFGNIDSTTVSGGVIALDAGNANVDAAGHFDDEILIIWNNAVRIISYLQ